MRHDRSGSLMRSDAVDTIRDRIDMVDLVSARVPLKRAGRNFKGLCPFHSEKSPSFIVFPETQSYHCFGCGQSGDAFTFYMETEGVDFRTALTDLARRTGVDLEPATFTLEGPDPHRDRVAEILKWTAELFQNELKTAQGSAAARSYLDRRGVDPDTVQQFEIGFAPARGNPVLGMLSARQVPLDLGAKAGVLQQSEEGDYYDRFRNRIIFPIHDREGRTVGFGGRALTDDQQPKYLNSPQSATFNKSALLYGLHMAKDAIRAQDQVVIVEGYMDVLTAHQFGYANVVAAMGTALTEQQIDLVKRLTKKIVLALDSDAAGQMASMRAISSIQESMASAEEFIADPVSMFRISRRLDGEIAIVALPAGDDPDSIIRKDPDAWEQTVDSARPYIEFLISNTVAGVDKNDATAKRRAIAELAPILHRIPDPVSRAHYAEFLARELGSRYAIVQAQVDRPSARPINSGKSYPDSETREATVSPEDHLIALLLKFRHAVLDLVLSVDPTGLSDSRNRAILTAMQHEATFDLETEDFLDQFDPVIRDHCLELLRPIDLRPAPLPGVLKEEIAQTMTKIERDSYEAIASHVRSEIAEAQRDGDEQALIRLVAMLEQLPELHKRLMPRKSPYFKDTQWPSTRRAKSGVR